jgi:precorrin-2 dehydrogenase/sirohydrochlorin ferrochelatase
VSYYPIFLDLRERSVLVVGGGNVARAKIAGLRRAGARVSVVAPAVANEIAALIRSGAISHVGRPYAPEDVRGFVLVVAATDDRDVNAHVSADARRAGVLVNVVDRPDLSTFIAPAVLQRGELQIAVSTSGRTPAFAAFVRDEVGSEIGPEYGVALAILGRVRERLRAEERPLAERKEVLRGLAEAGIVGLVRTKDRAAIDALLRPVLGDGGGLDALGVALD